MGLPPPSIDTTAFLRPPRMQRVVLGGELDGFASAAPDDHVRLFFPNAADEIVAPGTVDADDES